MTTFKDIQENLQGLDPATFIALEILGEISFVREEKGITQNELSALSGVPQKTISLLENGKNMPSFETLGKLMKALGIKPSISFK